MASTSTLKTHGTDESSHKRGEIIMRIENTADGRYRKVLGTQFEGLIGRLYQEIADRKASDTTFTEDIQTHEDSISALAAELSLIFIQTTEVMAFLDEMFPDDSDMAIINRDTLISKSLIVQENLEVSGESYFQEQAQFFGKAHFKDEVLIENLLTTIETTDFNINATTMNIVNDTLTLTNTNTIIDGLIQFKKQATFNKPIVSTTSTEVPFVIASDLQVDNLNVEFFQGTTPADYAPISHVGAGGATEHAEATDVLAGFMSAEDKAVHDATTTLLDQTMTVYVSNAEPGVEVDTNLWIDTSDIEGEPDPV